MIFNNPNDKPRFDRVSIRDARTIFQTNFTGVRTRYTQAGDCIFNVRIPDDILDRLETEPWNLKWTKANDEYPDSEAYLPIHFGWDKYPPSIFIVKNGKRVNKTPLSHEEFDAFNFDEGGKIAEMNVVIAPSVWWSDSDNEWRIKAYLQAAYITLREVGFYQDPFAAEYAEPDTEEEYIPFD